MKLAQRHQLHGTQQTGWQRFPIGGIKLLVLRIDEKELPPGLSLPVQVRQTIGHQIGHFDLQLVLAFQESVGQDNAERSCIDRAEVLAVELDPRTMAHVAQVDCPRVGGASRLLERNRIARRAGERP